MRKKEIIYLALIIFVASFFRLYQLEFLPPGIYPDEAINGNQALNEPGKIFYPENNGREGLFINLIALSFKIFGPSIWSFKIISAATGILTVLATYFLTKELFEGIEKQNRRIALFASFFLAVSFWHINFSRIAFRAILVPLFSASCFYFLFKGFRKQSIIDFIISGVLFGLGFYSYISFRLIYLPLIAVLFFQWLIWRQKKQQKQFLFFSFWFLLFVFLIASFLILYFLKNPVDFVGRAQGVSIFSQKNPLSSFAKSLFVHLAMFNVRGDANWRHNISGSPILFWPTGILFLVGLVYCLKKAIFEFQNSNWRPHFNHYGLLLFWWFCALLPGILTYEGIPHSLRCIAAIPATFILAGFGANVLCQLIAKKIPLANKSFGYYLVFLSLVLATGCFIFSQYVRYFEIWAKNPETENAFSKNLVEIGNYLNSLPDETQKYVIVNFSGVFVNGIPMPAQTPMFIENLKFGKTKSVYLLPKNLGQIKIKDGQQSIIIVMKYDKKIFKELILTFPQGQIEKKDNIWIFKAQK